MEYYVKINPEDGEELWLKINILSAINQDGKNIGYDGESLRPFDENDIVKVVDSADELPENVEIE